VGAGVGPGEGLGLGVGDGVGDGVGGDELVTVTDVDAARSPACAAMVALVVPLQVTRACPVVSVVTSFAERFPAVAERLTVTFGAAAKGSKATVSITISIDPPEAGREPDSGVIRMLCTAGEEGVGAGVRAVGADEWEHPPRRNSTSDEPRAQRRMMGTHSTLTAAAGWRAPEFI